MNMKEKLFLLKNRIFKPLIYKQCKTVIQNEKLSREALSDLNWEKRRKIVEYAYNNTQFYKEFYDNNNFHPSMLQTEKDWELVPLLSKQMIRENGEEIKVKQIDPKRFRSSTTGGSTGMPLQVFHDSNIQPHPIGYRFLKWWNVGIADNHATVHRNAPYSSSAILKDRLTWFPTKRIFLSASSYGKTDIKRFIQQIEKYQIKRIVGYVGAIETVADYIISNNVKVEGIEHIWATSSVLTKQMRQKIEQAFSCRVMDQYGCCEVNHLAQECPICNGLHINSDIVHLDIIDSVERTIIYDDRKGDIVVTDLQNMVFPIIRYELGDQSNFIIEHDKKCSLPFPLMNFVSGRTSDTITLPSQRVIAGEYLTTIFDGYVGVISSFQVVQKKDLSLTVKMVSQCDESKTKVVMDEIKATLQEKVNNEVAVNIEILDAIPLINSKRRYIIKE